MKFTLLTIVLLCAYYSYVKAVEFFSGFETFQFAAAFSICLFATFAMGIIEHKFEKGNDDEQ